MGGDQHCRKRRFAALERASTGDGPTLGPAAGSCTMLHGRYAEDSRDGYTESS